MACVSCEKYEKRITNVYRDEELKEKFEKLVRYPIVIDCFICDSCNSKLEETLNFQENCIRIYKKNNPNFERFGKRDKTLEEVKEHNEYLIIQPCEEIFTNDDDDPNDGQEQILEEDQYTVFEINSDGKEIELQQSVKKKQSRQSLEKLKNKKVQKCLVIDNQRVVEENLLNEEELLESISETQDISYKVECLDDSRGAKKGRKSYTVQQKLDIIQYAEKNSNREAARKFSLNESTIRCFKRQKEQLVSMNPHKSTNRHGTPYWPDLETKLKDWIEKQPARPKMNDVREEAIKIAKNLKLTNFSGSNTYIFKFMQRNNIKVASPRPRKKLIVDVTN